MGRGRDRCTVGSLSVYLISFPNFNFHSSFCVVVAILQIVVWDLFRCNFFLILLLGNARIFPISIFCVFFAIIGLDTLSLISPHFFLWTYCYCFYLLFCCCYCYCCWGLGYLVLIWRGERTSFLFAYLVYYTVWQRAEMSERQYPHMKEEDDMRRVQNDSESVGS